MYLKAVKENESLFSVLSMNVGKEDIISPSIPYDIDSYDFRQSFIGASFISSN